MEVTVLVYRRMLAGLVLAACLLGPATARAQTPFEVRVNTAIDSGINWLISQQGGDGQWSDWATGVALLSIEEQRMRPGYHAPPVRWENLTAAEQASVERGMRYLIRQVWGSSWYGY